MDYVIMSTISSAAAALVGWNEYRIRNMEARVKDALTKEEIEGLLNQKQELANILHQDVKEDIHEIKQKIDKLYDILLDS